MRPRRGRRYAQGTEPRKPQEAAPGLIRIGHACQVPPYIILALSPSMCASQFVCNQVDCTGFFGETLPRRPRVDTVSWPGRAWAAHRGGAHLPDSHDRAGSEDRLGVGLRLKALKSGVAAIKSVTAADLEVAWARSGFLDRRSDQLRGNAQAGHLPGLRLRRRLRRIPLRAGPQGRLRSGALSERGVSSPLSDCRRCRKA